MTDIFEYIKLFSRKDHPTVGFFGIGRSNLAIIERLRGIDSLEFIFRTDADALPEGANLPKGRRFVGKDAYNSITEDMLFLSPSVRRDRAEFLLCKNRGVFLTSDAEVFFYNPPKNVFAVTGSDGKSTVTYLTSQLLGGVDFRATPCGNYGIPFSAVTGDGYDAFVAELSSFNLQYMTPQTLRCAITNITPNHLNWHSSYEEYIGAKANLLPNSEGAVLPFDSEICMSLAKAGKLFALFSEKERAENLLHSGAEVVLTLKDGFILLDGKKLLDTRIMKRRERHNVLNMMTAIALSIGYTDMEKITSVAEKFGGLPHRAEEVGVVDGVRYINSSIDTTPARTVQTLTALNTPVHLILGGRGKGLPLDSLFLAVEKFAKSVSIYGEIGEELSFALKGISKEIPIMVFDHFCDAADAASAMAKPKDTVLLSPAATAYGEFPSFEERGMCFCKIIEMKKQH